MFEVSDKLTPLVRIGTRESNVHQVVISVCQDCIDLKGEECHEPNCIFCFRGMEEVKWILDKILVCPVIDGERYILAGDAVKDETGG